MLQPALDRLLDLSGWGSEGGMAKGKWGCEAAGCSCKGNSSSRVRCRECGSERPQPKAADPNPPVGNGGGQRRPGGRWAAGPGNAAQVGPSKNEIFDWIQKAVKSSVGAASPGQASKPPQVAGAVAEAISTVIKSPEAVAAGAQLIEIVVHIMALEGSIKNLKSMDQSSPRDEAIADAEARLAAQRARRAVIKVHTVDSPLDRCRLIKQRQDRIHRQIETAKESERERRQAASKLTLEAGGFQKDVVRLQAQLKQLDEEHLQATQALAAPALVPVLPPQLQRYAAVQERVLALTAEQKQDLELAPLLVQCDQGFDALAARLDAVAAVPQQRPGAPVAAPSGGAAAAGTAAEVQGGRAAGATQPAYGAGGGAPVSGGVLAGGAAGVVSESANAPGHDPDMEMADADFQELDNLLAACSDIGPGIPGPEADSRNKLLAKVRALASHRGRRSTPY